MNLGLASNRITNQWRVRGVLKNEEALSILWQRAEKNLNQSIDDLGGESGRECDDLKEGRLCTAKRGCKEHITRVAG